jgi:HSP20 family protein
MAGPFSEQIYWMQDMMNKFMDSMGISDWGQEYYLEDVAVPLADVEDTDDAIVVTMDLPGIDKEDVDISVTEDQLCVTAERREEKEEAEKEYHKRERSYTSFERVVELPTAVKADEASAKLENGVLEITLPKEIVTTRKKVNIA